MSTLLFHGQRLTRDHLIAVGASGFNCVDLFATRTHFDYHSPAAVADLQGWLADASLDLHAVHAPVTESFTGGRWGPLLSIASADASARTKALAEAEQALQIARRIPFAVFIVHLGVPRTRQSAPTDNSRDGARRSIEALQKVAEPLGVRLALEVIPNELSKAGSLAHFVDEVMEDVLDVAGVGICLDFGHANLEGDVVEAIETVSEHLIAVEAHDNRRRADDHLVPFDGSIDWPAALTTLQKVGYDGAVVLEVAAQGSEKETLKRAAAARHKIEKLLAAW